MTPVELSRTVLRAVRRAVDEGELSVAVPARAVVTVPGPGGCGDYATNIALQLARAAGRPPLQVAEILRPHLSGAAGVAEVAITGPGFLNISLGGGASAALVRDILERGAGYGHGDALAGQVVELCVPYDIRAEVVADTLVRIVATQGGRAEVRHAGPPEDRAELRHARPMTPVPVPQNSAEARPATPRPVPASKAPPERPHAGPATLRPVPAPQDPAEARPATPRPVPAPEDPAEARPATPRPVPAPEDPAEARPATLRPVPAPQDPAKAPAPVTLPPAPLTLRPTPALEDPAPLGPDAARWALLHPAPHDRPRISADHLVQRESNPLFRVRYAYARTRALSRNAAALGYVSDPGDVCQEEGELLGALAEYPHVLRLAATHRTPDRLARHLVVVADALLAFLHGVLPLGDEKPSAAHRARLALAEAAGTVLAGGLSLLGISAPDYL
ncbi:ArgS-related anticodon-binding protein NrtL [Streptomyces sp. NPDC048415]|uniref:ArgS-related anticodon-binding protein NrtL n=1 Tax=Streptomyces sp. NPDC048415 TaxID=3154822 RepID=UPI0034443FA7